jgi:hypothetical protein
VSSTDGGVDELWRHHVADDVADGRECKPWSMRLMNRSRSARWPSAGSRGPLGNHRYRGLSPMRRRYSMLGLCAVDVHPVVARTSALRPGSVAQGGEHSIARGHGHSDLAEQGRPPAAASVAGAAVASASRRWALWLYLPPAHARDAHAGRWALWLPPSIASILQGGMLRHEPERVRSASRSTSVRALTPASAPNDRATLHATAPAIAPGLLTIGQSEPGDRLSAPAARRHSAAEVGEVMVSCFHRRRAVLRHLTPCGA